MRQPEEKVLVQVPEEPNQAGQKPGKTNGSKDSRRMMVLPRNREKK